MQQQKRKTAVHITAFIHGLLRHLKGVQLPNASDLRIHRFTPPPLRNIFTFFFLSKLGSASTTQLYSVRCCSCFLKEDTVLYGWHAMLRFESRRRHRRQQICFGFKRDVEKRQCLGSSYFGLAANNCSLC